jgi:hypothetical protein
MLLLAAGVKKNLLTPLLLTSYNSVCTQIKNWICVESRKQLVVGHQETGNTGN